MRKKDILQFIIVIAMSAIAAFFVLSLSHMAKTERQRNELNVVAVVVHAESLEATFEAEIAVQAMTREIELRVVQTDGMLPEIMLEQETFAKFAEKYLDEHPALLSLAFLQVTDDPEVATSMAQGHALGVPVIKNWQGELYFPIRHLARNPRASADLFPYKSGSGRLPYALTGAEGIGSTISKAIMQNAPLPSTLMADIPGDNIAVNQTSLSGGERAVFWMFRPIYTRDVKDIPAAEHIEYTAGLVAALVDVRQLSPNANGHITISGPYDKANLPSIAKQQEKQSGTLSVVEKMFATGELNLSLPVRIGDGGFAIQTRAAKQSKLDAARPMIAALLVGAFLASLGLWGIGFLRKKSTHYETQITQSKSTLAKRSKDLKRSEERFRLLAESTNMVPWAVDLPTRKFTYIGPQIEELSGYPVSSWYSNGFWVDHVHPADRGYVSTEMASLQPSEYRTLEYRIRTADGRTLHLRNMLMLNEERSTAQGFFVDVTETKMAQHALEEARREAVQANKTKSEFLANMSHELRTPLNAVIGFSEIMKDEMFGPLEPQYLEYANSIHTSGKHLLALINDVLDLSKIEAGKIELVHEETNIASLLTRCRSLLHERATAAALHIRVEIPAALPPLHVDARRLKQVLLNLISNSIKFTQPGGRITLRAEVMMPKGMRIAVIDTGIGMTRSEVDIAMQQFGQIENELAREHDGTGLGLPIAKSLIELHGGEMQISSKKGAGTAVMIWLPLEKKQAGEAAA